MAGSQKQSRSFVTAKGVQLMRNGQPYYFIGANFWYGAMLGSKGEGGDRERLKRELDLLKGMGVNNLRVLVGGDTGSKNCKYVQPVLQEAPGVLNDELLQGLDYLLAEMQKRDMVAVLYLTNAWEWSGGWGYYLAQTGHGEMPDCNVENGWSIFTNYISEFLRSKESQQLYFDFVKAVVSRKNTVTRCAYKNDPTIMSWQLCNEPRPFAKDTEEAFVEWVGKSAALIKSLDVNHLVSVGSEGIIGCNTSPSLYERVHLLPDVDYLTLHLWPINWGWAVRSRVLDDLPNVYIEASKYIDEHERMANNIGKPVVVEEFGYPRDAYDYLPGSRVDGRNGVYSFVFNRVLRSAEQGGALAGCNFWGWGGTGRANGEWWKPGDDFISDPPHEAQGWYSVFDVDERTVTMVRESNAKLHVEQ